MVDAILLTACAALLVWLVRANLIFNRQARSMPPKERKEFLAELDRELRIW